MEDLEERKEELKKALGIVEKPPKEKRRNPWKVRINWGFWVLITGFIAWIIFQIATGRGITLLP
jgi:hypothetical protein